MITVACVYKNEQRLIGNGAPYIPADVRRLYDGVSKNLNGSSRFVCLTDRPGRIRMVCSSGVEIVGLTPAWRGWWSKMNLFRLSGPVLYFDLDTIITGSIDELAQAVIDSRKLVLLRGFYRGDRCTGVMGWSANVSTGWITEAFERDLLNPPVYIDQSQALRMQCRSGIHRGDQEWLDKALKTRGVETVAIQDLVSGVYSYKVHVQGKALPEDARLVCFHGKPRPGDVVDEPWMEEHWQLQQERR